MFRSTTSNVSPVSGFVAKGRQTLHHVSASPPLIPDGRISRVRLAATAFPQKPFPPNPKLKHSPAFTPGVSDLISSSTFFVVTLLTDTSSAVVHEMPAIYREPLCLLEVLPPKGRCPSIPSTDPLDQRYPVFIAHTDSCARPKSSYRFRSSIPSLCSPLSTLSAYPCE